MARDNRDKKNAHVNTALYLTLDVPNPSVKIYKDVIDEYAKGDYPTIWADLGFEQPPVAVGETGQPVKAKAMESVILRLKPSTTVRRTHAMTPTHLRNVSPHDTVPLTFSNGGRTVLFLDRGSRVREWDPSTDVVKPIITEQDGFDIFAPFSREDAVAAVVGGCKVKVWELPSGREIRTHVLDSSQCKWPVDLSADYTQVATIAGQSITIFDAKTGKVRLSFPCSDVGQLGKSEDDGEGHDEGDVLESDHSVDDGKDDGEDDGEDDDEDDDEDDNEDDDDEILFEDDDEPSKFVVFSPDGSLLVTGVYRDDSAKVWNAATGALEHVLRGKNGLHGYLFTPDGRKTILVSESDVLVFDSFTGRELRAIKARMHDPDISPDGRYLAEGQGTGLQVVVLESGVVHEIEGMKLGRSRGPAIFSRDGSRIASNHYIDDADLTRHPEYRGVEYRGRYWEGGYLLIWDVSPVIIADKRVEIVHVRDEETLNSLMTCKEYGARSGKSIRFVLAKGSTTTTS